VPTSWVYDGGTWLLRMSHSVDEAPSEVTRLIEREVHGLSLIVEGSGESAEEFSFSVISAIAGKCSDVVIASPAGIVKLPSAGD